MSTLIKQEWTKNWNEGKALLLQQLNGITSGGDAVKSNRVLFDLCESCLDGRLTAEQCVEVIQELDVSKSNVDSLSSLIDILNVSECRVQVSENSVERTRLSSLISALRVVTGEAVLKTRIGEDLLESAGVIPSKQAFLSKCVKTKTRLFYKQARFNLLREENEGYAKLVAELLAAPVRPLAPAEDSVTDSAEYDSMESKRRAQVAYGHIRALIGSFDLDSNRVLDLALDAFECQLSHFRFHIELLRFLVGDDSDAFAHIVGHKLHFYQAAPAPNSNSNSAAQETPRSLCVMIALLLQHGLIRLDALSAHLTPDDDSIESMYEKCVAEHKRAARANSSNTNTNAALDKNLDALPVGGDSQQPNAPSGGNTTAANVPSVTISAEEPASSVSPLEVNNQKFQLCIALIRIANWRDAKAILERFKTDVIMYQPSLLRSLCDLFEFLIEPIYRSSADLPEAIRKRCVSRMRVFDDAFTNTSSAGEDEPVSVDQSNNFYLDEAIAYATGSLQKRASNVADDSCLRPVSNYTEFARLVSKCFVHLGPFAHAEPRLIGKLLRIAARHFDGATDGAKPDAADGGATRKPISACYQAIFNLLDCCVLPSLSLLDGNYALAEQIWNVMKHLPVDHRYRLYGQWKTDAVEYTAVQRARSECLDKVRYLMKRLTKENVKQSGRQLGKLTHANPCVVLDYAIAQIQRYDNLIGPVIDSLRYLSSLAYDTLGYCLIEALAEPSRQSEKLDELTCAPATWLQSIATFSGGAARKYVFEVGGLLQFTANQLKAGRTTDLIVLNELIVKMAGVELNEQITDAQLDALCGGDFLQQDFSSFQFTAASNQPQSGAGSQPAAPSASGTALITLVGAQGGTSTPTNATAGSSAQNSASAPAVSATVASKWFVSMRKTAARLRDALVEFDLFVPLLVLVAQRRDEILFRTVDSLTTHVKLLSRLYDACQDTLVQFGTFASFHGAADESSSKKPVANASCPSIDVLVDRYKLSIDSAFFIARPTIHSRIAQLCDELKRSEAANREKDAKEKEKEEKPKDRAAREKREEKQRRAARYNEASQQVLTGVSEAVKPLFPNRTFEEMSSHLFAAFWTLRVSDIYVPVRTYDLHIRQLRATIASGRFDANEDAKEKKRTKEKLTGIVERLENEKDEQTEHVQMVTERLRRESESWFTSKTTQRNDTMTMFLQMCVYQRACFTAQDALYCARFILLLHQLKTPNFPTLICYDRIFNDITNTVSCCTESEAHRYGRFLSAALEVTMSWHSDRRVYESECYNFPGFVTVFRKGGDANTKADPLEYENYRHVCHKWHYRITKAMVACLESNNYVQIRNALIVLTRILLFYPKVTQFGQALERRVDRIKQEEKDKRPDIYALAVSYSGQLKNRKSFWLVEADFHLKEEDGQKKSGGAGVKDLASVKESASADASSPKPAASARAGQSKNASSSGPKSQVAASRLNHASASSSPNPRANAAVGGAESSGAASRPAKGSSSGATKTSTGDSKSSGDRRVDDRSGASDAKRAKLDSASGNASSGAAVASGGMSSSTAGDNKNNSTGSGAAQAGEKDRRASASDRKRASRERSTGDRDREASPNGIGESKRRRNENDGKSTANSTSNGASVEPKRRSLSSRVSKPSNAGEARGGHSGSGQPPRQLSRR